MRYTLGAVVALGCLLVRLSGAAAYEVPEAEVTVADSHRVDGTRLVLNNAVLLEVTVLAVDVYVAALYLPAKSSDPARILACDGPRRIDLRFMRDIERDQLVERWKEEVIARAKRRSAFGRYRGAIDALFAAYRDVREGQVMSFVWRPGKGIEVALDGKTRATVAGDAGWCALFLSGFVGPEAKYEDMREGLLAR